MQEAELLYKLGHIDDVNSIAELIEMLCSFSFAGSPEDVDAQRHFSVTIANKLVSLAAAEAAAIVMLKLGHVAGRR